MFIWTFGDVLGALMVMAVLFSVIFLIVCGMYTFRAHKQIRLLRQQRTALRDFKNDIEGMITIDTSYHAYIPAFIYKESLKKLEETLTNIKDETNKN